MVRMSRSVRVLLAIGLVCLLGAALFLVVRCPSTAEDALPAPTLAVSDATLMISGEEAPLKIPSGRIKLVKNFNIEDEETTTLTLDFDAQQSVHQAGSRYIMKPTIKVSVE